MLKHTNMLLVLLTLCVYIQIGFACVLSVAFADNVNTMNEVQRFIPIALLIGAGMAAFVRYRLRKSLN